MTQHHVKGVFTQEGQVSDLRLQPKVIFGNVLFKTFTSLSPILIPNNKTQKLT